MDEHMEESPTPPASGADPGSGASATAPDAPDATPDRGALDAEPDGIDPDLMRRARALTEVPLPDRAEAFDELNRDVVAALRAIEEL